MLGNKLSHQLGNHSERKRMSISILLVDDHTILRQGLRALLVAEPDFTIVGETGSGLEALQLAEKLHPLVIILDLELPDLKGLEVARQIHQRLSDTRIVILSMHAKEAYVLEALQNGAIAYVLKGSETRDLVQAIRQSMRGVRYLSPPLTESAIQVYLQKTQDQEIDPYDTLTNRERQVLHLAAKGHTNQEISEILFISLRTAETHRTKMMKKLSLHNQNELVRYALRKGIISMDD